MKLASWKGMLLTMAGRVQLVKSVIQGMMVYTMMVYQWPKMLLHNLEMLINNFVWNGEIHKRGGGNSEMEIVGKLASQ